MVRPVRRGHTVGAETRRHPHPVSGQIRTSLRRAASGRVLRTLHRITQALEVAVEADAAIWAALVGLTAGEGLGFNRAFILLDEDGVLRGHFGVGPQTRDDAQTVWSEIRKQASRPFDHLMTPDPRLMAREQSRHAATLRELTHPVQSDCEAWRQAFVARGVHQSSCVCHWIKVLDSPALAVLPMVGGARPWGVIIADNFVTRSPITPSLLQAAETLVHTLRVALERTHLLAKLRTEHEQLLAAEHAATLLETTRSLAHDLKNPLALAGGLARELAADPSSDPATLGKRLGIIADAVRRAEERVSELTEGIAPRAAAVDLRAVDVGTVAESVVEAFRPLMAARAVRLLCYRPPRPLLAAAVPSRVDRCLENLVGNALNALSPTGGTVQVVARENSDWIRLEVSDDGPPLPQSLRTAPFAGGVTTRRGGSGLGLASVRRMAESMGGHVEYDENDPGWVRFTVLLRRWS